MYRVSLSGGSARITSATDKRTSGLFHHPARQIKCNDPYNMKAAVSSFLKGMQERPTQPWQTNFYLPHT